MFDRWWCEEQEAPPVETVEFTRGGGGLQSERGCKQRDNPFLSLSDISLCNICFLCRLKKIPTGTNNSVFLICKPFLGLEI